MALELGHFEKVRAIATSKRLIAIGGVRVGTKSQVVAFDPTSNKRLWAADVPAHVLGACIANDLILCALSDGQVCALRAADGHVAWSYEAHAGAVTSIASAPDERTFATVGADGVLNLWTPGTNKPKAAFTISTQPLFAVAFSPDGLVVAAGGDDGVVTAVTPANGSRREMPGHEGAVRAVRFAPRDGRVVSGGDDGTIRLHYLEGPLEHETRGADDSGHEGGVLALSFTPTPPVDKDGEESGDRLFSAGADGKIKMWRLGDRRKPRTFETDRAAIHALAMGPAARGAAKDSVTLFAAGDARTIYRFTLDATSTPAEGPETYNHGLASLETAIAANQRPAREVAVRTLAALDEVEGRALLARVLESDRDPVVRALAAAEIEANKRHDMLAAIRARLDDGVPAVRQAAYGALLTLSAAAPLGALRAALQVRAADVRRRALAELPSVGKGSPLSRPMAVAALSDLQQGVRMAALDALVALGEPAGPGPLRVAFAGPSDVRVDVLGRIAAGGVEVRTSLAALVARALDDEIAEVRRAAFLVSVLERPALAAKLFGTDQVLARAFDELCRRTAELAEPRGLPGFGPDVAVKAPSDTALRDACARLMGGMSLKVWAADKSASQTVAANAGTFVLTEADLAPLVAAAACRAPDTALAGAAALAQLGDGRALGALLQVSRDGDAAIRGRAASALAELGGAHACKRLAWMLDDAHADVRGRAFDALAAVHGNDAVALIEAALRSSQDDIRVRGLSLLVRAAERGSGDVLGLLEDAIEDESASVRLEALRTLWVLRKDEPFVVIERALAARFADVRRRAVDELVARKKDEKVPAMLKGAIGDRDESVAAAAYDALVDLAGKRDSNAHLVAMASTHAAIRVRGAAGAVHAPVDEMRSTLIKLLEDDAADVRTAAIESLDRLADKDDAPLRLGLQSSHLDLRVRAAELCAIRGQDALVDPMRALLLDKDLERRMTSQELSALRFRASSALATLGAPSTIRLFVDLLKDKDPLVREQAARGLANTVKRGHEGPLLDALGHADLAVRSWVAEGLARIGDVRALPVLVGTLRHPHAPIRVGAVLSFAALGPEGYGGMLQGLEDPSEEVQETVLLVMLARDLGSARRGHPPDLLSAALSASRPEIRFAAARALELRHDGAAYLSHLIAALLPPKPEKAADMKNWPAEPKRGHIAVGLAEALTTDRPEQRYAAAQVLKLRNKPRDFFREAEKVAKPRLVSSPWIGDNAPRSAEVSDVEASEGWLRKLFTNGVEGRPEASGAPQPELVALAFGAYVGMIRIDATDNDEGHRVRRDAVDRITAHALEGYVARELAIAPLVRALADGHHLVRKAAFVGLQKVFAPDAETPLSMALASPSADIARAALDELSRGGTALRPRIAQALDSPVADVRRYAFELLEKLSPKGSLDPFLWALSSEYTDMRLGVLDKLTSAADPRVRAALGRAVESEQPDVRLRAAELLASLGDDRAAEVLSALLRSDEAAVAIRANDALVTLGTRTAAEVLSARADELAGAERARFVATIGKLSKTEVAIRALAAFLRDEDSAVRQAALQAGLNMIGRDVKKRDHTLGAIFLAALARAKDPALRLIAANELAFAEQGDVDEIVSGLLRDRDAATRVAAAQSYATRVRDKNAPVAPLLSIVAAGTRELLLSAAEGVATRGLPAALGPLLLFARAGEVEERRRALLALGYSNDKRAFEELIGVCLGSATEEPIDPVLRAAAIEALGRIHGKLEDGDLARRARDAVEDAARGSDRMLAAAAARGLRHIGGDIGRSRLELLLTGGGRGEVGVAAAEALGELGFDTSELALAQALTSYDDDVSKAAHEALLKLFPKDRTRVALHALSSSNTEVAEPAAAYLSTEGDPAELLPRLATLDDETLITRLRFGLLRRMALPTSALVSLLNHESPAAREGAAWLIGNRASSTSEQPFGADDLGLLGPALVAAADKARRAFDRGAQPGSDEEKAWTRALWAAGRCKLAAIAPAARQALEHASLPSPVRAEAASTLGLLGQSEDSTHLVAAIRDRDASVRKAAAAALAISSPGVMAGVYKTPFLDPDALARFAHVNGALLGAPSARPLALRAALVERDTSALVSLAKDTSADLAARQDAVLTLGRAGGQQAQETLTALAFDKSGDVELRKAAYRGLRRAQRIDLAARAHDTSSGSQDSQTSKVNS